ncbi:tail fiber protein, partial [Alienimonas chondri]|uniref:tail fiber protein n=1 Tax=Alienimonas chondri TaxID=2681879 RepID=UPI001488E157
LRRLEPIRALDGLSLVPGPDADGGADPSADADPQDFADFDFSGGGTNGGTSGDGASGGALDGGAVRIDAGADANDGVADRFTVSEVDGRLVVSVNGRTAYAGDAADPHTLHFAGSADADHLFLDPALFQTAGGNLDVTFDGAGGADTVELGGEVGSVAHHLLGGTTDAGSDPTDAAPEANTAAADGLNLAHTDVEQVADRFDATTRTLTVDGAADLHGTGTEGVFTDGLTTVTFAADADATAVEAESLTVTGALDLAGGEGTFRATDSLGLATGAELTSAGGSLTLDGGASLTIAGTVDVSDATGHGGTATLLGDAIELTDTATVDASGANGGGAIYIGGGYQGSDPALRNAEFTTIAEGARLDASATAAGDGGTVIVWANDTTRYAGHITARGLGSGDGGFAEVSGKEHVLVTGHADLRSDAGAWGTFLIDPGSVDIVDGDAATLPGSGMNTFTDAYIVDQLENHGGLTITTSASDGANGADETITVAGDVQIVWAASTAFSLVAGRAIVVNSGARIEATGDGSIDFRANEGKTQFATGNTHGVRVNGAIVATRGTGDVSVIGTGSGVSANAHGVSVTNAGVIEATGTGLNAGAVVVIGTGGDSGYFSHGVVVDGTSTAIRAAGGGVTVTGTGSDAGYGYGVFVQTGGVIEDTGTAGSGGADAGAVVVTGIARGSESTRGVAVSNGTLRGGGVAVTGTGTGSAEDIWLTNSTIESTTVDAVTLDGADITINASTVGLILNDAAVDPPVAGIDYGQLVVTGELYLDNSTLVLTATDLSGVAGLEEFTLIENDGADLIADRSYSRFSGIVEGAILTVGGREFAASYEGGDGNDFTLLPLTDTDAIGGDQPFDNRQPAQGLNYIIATRGVFPSPNGDYAVDDVPFLGEIKLFAGSFAPEGYAFADGQMLQVSTNSALFSVLGTTYGGNGRTTFALPDLRSRVAIGAGSGPGLSSYVLGQEVGEEFVTLTADNLPAHTHGLPDGGNTQETGGGQARENVQPALAINYLVRTGGDFEDLGEIGMFAGTFAPTGWALADGQLLEIAEYSALFSKLGATYGGDGRTDFALPDLRGRVAVSEGDGPTTIPVALGQTFGTESEFVTVGEMPRHAHGLPTGDTTGSAGGGQSDENRQPSLGVNYTINTVGFDPSLGGSSGVADSDFLGEIELFAAHSSIVGASGENNVSTDGQLLAISGNEALFSILGTTYGGDGRTTFGLPDLRGRTAIHEGSGSGLSTVDLGEFVGSDLFSYTVDQLPSHTHLAALQPPSGTYVATLSGGDLLINEALFGLDNVLSVTLDGNEIVLDDGAGQVERFALADLIGDLVVNLGGGDDALTIDAAVLTAGLNVDYDGGSQATAVGDALTIDGGAFNSTVYTFTTSDADGFDGIIDLDGSVIVFAGLEPLVNTGTAANVLFILPNVVNADATLAAGPNPGEMQLTGSTFENTVFTVPTGSLEIFGGTEADTITVAPLDPSFAAALRINGAGGFDTVNLNADVTFAADESLLVTAETIAVGAGAELATSGAGTITLTAARNITLADGSSLTTVDGGVALSANRQAIPTVGDFIGIAADGAVIRTDGTGAISLLGTGAEVGSDTSHMFGVYLHSGTSVSSTAAGAAAGTITIDGTAGAGTDFNYGVYLRGSTTDVTSVDGAIAITGRGGSDGIGTGFSNYGVFALDIATISSTGTGADAATITIDGTGGAGTSFNHGVYLFGPTTDVTSVAGAIDITGQGTGTSSSNVGVFASGIGTIASTGTGADAATITIDGAGGAGAFDNHGVRLSGGSTDVTSVDGDIAITGQGGSDGTGTRGNSNYGVLAFGIETIASTGAGADAATITIDGTAGAGTSDNSGVFLAGPTTDVTSVNGDIVITGRGAGTGSFSHGVAADNIETIASTGTGADAATITIEGTGGAGTDGNYGVYLLGGSTDVTSVDGAIAITGRSDGTGDSNYGVHAFGIGTIASTGTGADAATITIDGTGGAGSNFNYGVYLAGGTTDVTSVDGAIDITGRSGGTGFDNHGVYASGIGTIASTGTGPNAAAITIDGTAGAGTYENHGVYLFGSSTNVTSVAGDVAITGRSDGAGDDNYGVYVASIETIASTGTGPDAATITIDGTGGAGANDNHGVYLSGATTDVSSVDGAIAITGQGRGTGSSNRGVLVASIETIASTGTGPDAATITIDGTGSPGTYGNHGVHLLGDTTDVTSVDGAIAITGQGAGTGNGNYGVYVSDIETIASTGTGPDAATITIDGTGGAGTSFNYGVYLRGSTTDVTSVVGDIAITGQGAGIGVNNYGVWASFIETISSTGTGPDAATITIDGTGGAGTLNNYGVYLRGSSTDVTSVDGAISITGQGGGTGIDNYGVYASGIGTITSTGTGADAATITIDGTGGAGASENHGVFLLGDTTDVTSVDGAIAITGQGAGSGVHNYGVFAASIETIASTGTGPDAATITIDGTAGAGTDNNHGVFLSGFTTDVTSVAGAIAITGQGAGTGSFNYGVYASYIETISSTGTGTDAATITIEGTGGAGTLNNYGVYLFGSSTDVTSVAGDIAITGQGGGTDANNHGVYADDIETISSTGTGAAAGTITIDGTGGAGTDGNYGVFLVNSSTGVTSVDGDIRITGQGAGAGHSNYGVYSASIATISSTGTGADAATITIEGTGGAGTDENHGVYLFGSSTDVTSVDGAIAITGQGGGTGDQNYGVYAKDIDTITSTGTGANAATITIMGTGGDGTDENYGVYLEGITTNVTSVDGAIEIIGQGAGTRANNYGVYAAGIKTIESTGMGPDAATITIKGDAAGTDFSSGVVLLDNSSMDPLGSTMDVTSVDGAIKITGEGAGGGRSNNGVYVAKIAISSTGTGADAATITIDGTGGAGTNTNVGVFLTSSTMDVTSVDGDIAIIGRSNGTGVQNYGVLASAIETIASTGTGPDAATITINGTGGAGTANNYGVWLIGLTTDVTSNDGAIAITGSSTAGRGVWLRSAAAVTSAGDATIAIAGAGAGATDGEGVLIADDSTIDGGANAVTITVTDSELSTETEDGTAQIFGGLVTLNAVGTGSVGATDRVEIDATTLAGTTEGGVFRVVDLAGGVTVVGVDTTLAGGLGGAGDVEIVAKAGSVAFTGALTTGGAVTVTADDDITFTAAGDVTATAGTGDFAFTADADGDANGAGGAFTQADGSVIVSNGVVTITADEDVSLASVQTTAAGLNKLFVTSGSGAIFDAGDSDVDLVADFASVNLSAATSIGGLGAGEELETTISTLDAAAATGVIAILESNGLNLLDVSALGAGGVIEVASTVNHIQAHNVRATDRVTLNALGAAGNVQEFGFDAHADVTAASVSLLAGGNVGAGHSGDVGGALELDADTLAFAVGGTIDVTNDGALTIDDVAVSGGGTLTASSAGAGGSVTANSPLTIDHVVTVGDAASDGTAANMTFEAGGDAANADDDLTISTAGAVDLIDADASTLTFLAGDDVILNSDGTARIATANNAAHAVVVTADTEADGTDGDRGSISQTGTNETIVAPTLTLSAHDGIGDDGTTDNALRVNVDTLSAINAGANEVRLVETNAVAVDRIENVGRRVVLIAGGAIADGNAGIGNDVAGEEDANIVADELALIGGSVGQSDDLDLAVDTVAAQATAGFLHLTGAGALTVGSVTDAALADAGLTGGVLAGLTSDTRIILRAGSIDVTERIGGLSPSSSIDVLLDATGAGVSAGAGDVTLAADVDAGTGGFSFVTLRAADDVTQSAGRVATFFLRAAAGGLIDLDSATNDAADFAATAGGSVTLVDVGGVNLGGGVGLTNSAFGSGAPTGAPGDSDDFFSLGVSGVTAGTAGTGADVLICTTGALGVNQQIDAGDGTVRLEAAGSVTQTADGVITADALGVRATGTGSAIDLALALNDVNTFAAATDADGGSIAFADVDGFALGTVAADATVVGCFDTALTGVTAGGSVTLDADADADCDGDLLIAGAASAGAGGSYAFSADNITVAANVTATGAGAIDVIACRTIRVNSGVTVEAVDGNVTFEANADLLNLNAGNFTAVTIGEIVGAAAAVRATGDGNVSVTGVGASDGTTSSRRGVLVQNDSVIAANAGAVTVAGTGGTGEDFNYGVYVVGTNSAISSAGGGVTVTGTGGSNGTAGSNSNAGVRVTNGTIADTAAGAVSVTGTGGAGEDNNQGVLVNGTGSAVSSAGGGVTVAGTGGSNGSADSAGNVGVFVSGSGTIEDTAAGAVSVTGTGGDGEDFNYGVYVTGTDSAISSTGGGVTVEGTGGSNGSSGSSDNYGVFVNGGTIADTGVGAAAGAVSVTGTGGNGEDDNVGVWVRGTGSAVSSAGGGVTVIGTGGSNESADSSNNYGVYVFDGGTIKDDAAGLVSVTGTGGDGEDFNYGVYVTGTDSAISSTGGGVTVIGTGGSNGQAGSISNFGVIVNDGTIADTGVGMNAGAVSVTGTGGAGEDFNYGVFVLGTNAAVSSVGGGVTVAGAGGSNGSADSDSNHGVYLTGGGTIADTAAGAVSVTGTGGNGEDDNVGVWVRGTGSTVSSAGGGVTVTGTGGSDGSADSDDNVGVYVFDGGTITDDAAGLVSVTGTGGDGEDLNHGVLLSGANSAVTSAGGGVTVIGTGGSNNAVFSSDNYGVSVISSVIADDAGGAVSVTGTGGAGEDGNFGVYVVLMNAAVRSAGGGVTVTGTGGSNGTVGSDANVGVTVSGGGVIEDTAAGLVTVTGTGGDGEDGNHGVFVSGADAQISSTGGGVTVTGTGGSNGAAGSAINVGVYVSGGGAIADAAAGLVSVTGTGGDGEDFNYGVLVSGTTSTVSSTGGGVTVAGTGGSNGLADSNSNIGVVVDNGGTIADTGVGAAAGAVSVTGTGGDGEDDNYGVLVFGTGAAVTSTGGGVTVAGTGGSNGQADSDRNYGVVVDSGGTIADTGVGAAAGLVSVTGTGGDGEDFNYGVYVVGTDSAVSSVGGGVTVTGTGGSNEQADSNSNYGVYVINGGVIADTAAGLVSVAGTGGAGEDGNHGVFVFGTDAAVRSAGGGVTVAGTGGSGGLAGSELNHGVYLLDGTIADTAAGLVSVTGTGGAGDDFNYGVLVSGTTSTVSSKGGGVTVTGTGGSNGLAGSELNYGVYIADGTIADTAAGAVSVTGTGGAGEDSNRGVYIFGANSAVSSVGGGVTVTGTGGSNGSADSDFNDGVSITGGGTIADTAGGAVSVTGTGGAGDDFNRGVFVFGAGAAVTSAGGGVTVTGTGGSNGLAGSDGNEGVYVFLGGTIADTGAGAVDVTGRAAGMTTQDVLINGATTAVRSGSGTITITGLRNDIEMRNGGRVLSDSGAARLWAAGNVLLGTVNLDFDAAGAVGSAIVTADFDTTAVDATNGVAADGVGAILDNLTGETANITAFSAALRAAGDVGANPAFDLGDAAGAFGGDDADLDLAVDVVAVFVSGDGDVNLDDVDDLIVDTADGIVGVTVAGSGDVRLAAVNDLTIDAAVAVNGTDGSIFLVADSDGDCVGDLTINAPVTAGSVEGSLGLRSRNITVSAGQTLSAHGAGTIDLFACRTIVLENGAAVVSADGKITLDAGSMPDANDNFAAVTIGDAFGAAKVEATGAGDVSVTGVGASDGTTSFNYGVLVQNGSVIAANAGSVSVTGTGGNGVGANLGVNVVGTNAAVMNTAVTSAGGGVTVIGTGGSNGLAGSRLNVGVGVSSGGAIVDTAAGAVSVTGTGGAGADNNHGVFVNGTGSEIGSKGGGVTVEGTGRSNGLAGGFYNVGVFVAGGGKIADTGAGAAAGAVSVTGTGGDDDDFNIGVYVRGTGAEIGSQGGGVTVKGTGGSLGLAGSNNNHGVFVAGGTIKDAAAGAVSVTGTGGAGEDDNYGVYVTGAGAEVTSAGGGVTVIGTGGSNESAGSNVNRGVFVSNKGAIKDTAAGAVTVTGTGGAGEEANVGVVVSGADAQISSKGGGMTVTGTGGSNEQADSIRNFGVYVFDGGTIADAASGAVSVTGTGGDGERFNLGVLVSGSGSAVSSAGGGVTVAGTGGSNEQTGSALNYGVYVVTGGTIADDAAGAVSVTGTGGDGEDGNVGVWVSGAGSAVTSAGGGVTVTGTGGSNEQADSDANVGVYVSGGGTIADTGVGAAAGAVSVTGTGGDGEEANRGVWISGAGSAVTSKGGGVTVAGTGGSNGLAGSSANHGVYLLSGGTITDAAAGAVSVTGLAAAGADSVGVHVVGSTIQNAGTGMVTVRGDVTDPGGVDGIRVENSTISTTDGEIVLNADFTDAADLSAAAPDNGPDGRGTLNVFGTGAVTAGGLGNDVTITAADVRFDSTAVGGAVVALGDTVFLNNSTAGQAIVLGGAGAAGGFDLSTAGAGQIAAAVLEVGNNDPNLAAGTIALGDAPFSGLAGGAGNAEGTLVLRTGADVVELGADAAADLSQITNLAVLAGGRVGGATDAVGDRLEIDADVVAFADFDAAAPLGGDGTQIDGSVRIARVGGDLTVGAVAVPSGANAAGLRATGEVEVFVDGSLTVQNASAGDDLRGTELAAIAGGSLTVEADADVATTGANSTPDPTDGNAVLRADGGDLTLEAGSAVTTAGGKVGLEADGAVTMQENALSGEAIVTTAGGDAVLRARTGDVTLTRVNAGAGQVGIDAAGAVIDGLTGDGAGFANVSGAALGVLAGTGVGTVADPLDVAVTTFAAETAAGDVQIVNRGGASGDVIIDCVIVEDVVALNETVAGLTAIGLRSTTGAVDVVAPNGSVIVNKDVFGGTRATLDARDDVRLNADVGSDAATGRVAIRARTGDLTQPGADSITAGAVALEAGGKIGEASFSNPGQIDAINVDTGTIAARAESGVNEGVGIAQRGGRMLTIGSVEGVGGDPVVGVTTEHGTASVSAAGGVNVFQAVGDQNPFGVGGPSGVDRAAVVARGNVTFAGPGRLTTAAGQAVAPLPGTIVPVTGSPAGEFIVGQTGDFLEAGSNTPVDFAVQVGTRRGGIADQNVTVQLILPNGQLSPNSLPPGTGGTIFNFGPQSLPIEELIELATLAAQNGGTLSGAYAAFFDPSIRLIGGVNLGAAASDLTVGDAGLTFRFGDVVAADPLPDPDPEPPAPPEPAAPIPPPPVFVAPPALIAEDEAAPASSAPASDLPELQLWIYEDQSGLTDGLDGTGDPALTVPDLAYYLIGDPFRSAYLSDPYFQNLGAEGAVFQFVIVRPGQDPEVESTFRVESGGVEQPLFRRGPAPDFMDDAPPAPVGPAESTDSSPVIAPV